MSKDKMSPKNKDNVLIKITDKENVVPMKEQTKDGELDKVIANLRNAYIDMKKERVKTEKDSEHLEHKLKMLQGDELTAYRKFQNEKKVQRRVGISSKEDS